MLMQFPLENLYQFLVDPATPQTKPVNRQTVPPVSNTLKQSLVRAKLLLFSHISNAESPKKVQLILLSVQVAIADLRKTVRTEKHPQEQEIINLLELLEDFIQDNFQESIAALLQNSATAPAAESIPSISIALSVPQLAVLLRLLVDAGIITGVTNITHFTGIVAKNISTHKPVPVSAESLRSKYYSPDIPSLNIMKQHLLKMMRLISSYTP